MKISVVFLLIIILPDPAINAQNSSFIFKTNLHENYFPSYTSNGNFSLSTTKRGTDPSESYMIRIYDHGKDDIPRIVMLPENIKALTLQNFYIRGKKYNIKANVDSPEYIQQVRTGSTNNKILNHINLEKREINNENIKHPSKLFFVNYVHVYACAVCSARSGISATRS